MRLLRALALAALLLADDAAAQAFAPATQFEGLSPSAMEWCQSYQPSIAYGGHPTCVWNTSAQTLGRLRYVETGTPYDLATTETKGAHVLVGSGLVFRRSESTSGPPACSTIPDTAPCFTYQGQLATVPTCHQPGLGAGLRGLDVSATVAATNAAIRGYAASERPGGTPVRILQATRPDLITWPEMELAGFQCSFLVETSTGDFDALETFLGGPSQWTWSERGVSTDWNERDEGVRIEDLLQQLTCNPKAYAHYLTRPSLLPVSPNASVADLTDPAYRAWKIAHLQAVVAEAGADLIALETKFAQRTQPNGGGNYYVLHANNCGGDTLTDFLRGSCAGSFNGGGTDAAKNPQGGFTGNVEAAGYGWAQYIQGLAAFATELRAAGIGYRIASSGQFLDASPANYYDDPATVGVNENDLVRDLVYGAAMVWLTDGEEALEAQLRDELRRRGISWCDGDCSLN